MTQDTLNRFDEEFPCDVTGCDSQEHIQVAEDEWEQCQRCSEVRMPIKAFIKKEMEMRAEEIKKDRVELPPIDPDLIQTIRTC
ncbi:MAG: hypothetical protein ACTSW1_08435 [Candidatus Hodarchaeales archaeon]